MLLAVALGGCATAPDRQVDPEGYAEFVETNDPYEPFNRAMFDFNLNFDKVVLTPLSIFYRDILPPIMQQGMDNVLANMRMPVNFINEALQGDPDGALNTLGRFFVNSTIGIGGLADVASHLGMERTTTDFGQTLAVWGVDEGPYLVLPVLGPSNPRDAVGRGVDSVAFDPFGLLAAIAFSESGIIAAISYSRTGLDAINQRARALEPFDELQKSSLDFYAAVRSAYRQNRRFEIEKLRPVRTREDLSLAEPVN